MRIKQNDRTVSRMNCWIFNFASAIVIVDGWSVMGTSLVDREATAQEYPASVPNARRAFVVPHDEAATLRLGPNTEVTLNPKLCIVCLDRPRSVRLQCGHQAFCSTCAGQCGGRSLHLTECPICRVPIHGSGVEIAARAVCAVSYCAREPEAEARHHWDASGCAECIGV